VTIDPRTSIGVVELTVSDTKRSRRFYEDVIGLAGSEGSDGTVTFAIDGERPLLRLHGDPSAPPLDPRATGLFHFALLVPSRRELALSLARLREAGWSLTGASDHLVSEALYLRDPDGNGIEIYRDRPREQWPHDRAGSVQIATLPLDLVELSGELDHSAERTERMPAGTVIGHVHLQVTDLPSTDRFYGGALGLEVTVRTYPGALFLSAGGYHHHVGANIWHSRGMGPPPEGAVGLRSFEFLLPDHAALAAAADALVAAGVQAERGEDGLTVRDPSGNHARLNPRVR
jgi:catechol 2,3-dioxygenase